MSSSPPKEHRDLGWYVSLHAFFRFLSPHHHYMLGKYFVFRNLQVRSQCWFPCPHSAPRLGVLIKPSQNLFPMTELFWGYP